MDIAFSRAAFSPVIAEADDRSSGIYDRDDRRADRQGELGLPVFVGTMQYSTAELIRLIGEGKAGAPEPGDIYIVNDPYLGGTHLMDVRFAHAVLLRSGEHLLLAAEHRPLARHRRHGAGRLLGHGDRGRAGGAAAAAGEAVQARRAGSPRSTPSSAPTSASPTSASATSRRRPPR